MFMILFFLASSLFANIIIDFDVSGITGVLIKETNPFLEGEDSIEKEFVPLSGLELSILWEFNSSVAKPVHFATGLTSGIVVGLLFSVPLYINYTIFQNDKICIDFQTLFSAGIVIDLFYYVHPYINICPGFTIMKSTRKGLFASLGLNNENSFYYNIYKGVGTEKEIISGLDFQLGLGVRF